MSKIEKALWANYEKANNRIESLTAGSEEYKAALEERDKLRNELIKLEQISQDNSVKLLQIESENRRENIRNGITIGTFTITTMISLYGLWKTFKFDEVATVTSTLGRGILNGVVPKLFKR